MSTLLSQTEENAGYYFFFPGGKTTMETSRVGSNLGLQVSRIAGRRFTIWATSEAQSRTITAQKY